jgi:hypothetical protein
MISLHTWVDRLISKQLWLLALQHRNNTLKEKLLLIWSGLSWTESPPSEGHDWNVCSMPVVFQTKGDNTLSWSGLSWTESPPVLSRDMIEVCGPSRLYFKPRETILWVDLVWVEPSHPPCYWGTWSGCVFRAGCVSNRGRQHFELIWFDLTWWPEAYGGSGLMVTRGLRQLRALCSVNWVFDGPRLTGARGLWWPEAYGCSRTQVFGARVMPSLLKAWRDFCLFLLLSFSVESLY